MPKLPVVFIHFGDAPPYAAQVLAHARSFGNEVVFLNPTMNELHAHPFARVYEHLSTNHYDFELSCIVRWFWLRDWMWEHDDEFEILPALYLDTDVLLYANAAQEYDTFYHKYYFTLSLGTSGHTSFWHFGALGQFCDWLTETYTAHGQVFGEMLRIYSEMQAQNLAGGISDMALLKMFANLQEDGRVGEMSEVRDGALYDHNINVSDGFYMERVGGGKRKQIRMVDGTPYGFQRGTGAIVRFKSLHFQGGAKEWIPQYAYERVVTE